MKRINTINARPDVNGAGKAGFHDNADISGQDATYLDPSWCNHVQEELANVIEGFGTALDPAQKNQVYTIVKGVSDQVVAVSQRTSLIENFIENIVDYFYPVGVVIDFGIPNFNPNVKYIGTTWIRHGEGRASVGLSTNLDDPDWTKAVGSIFGSYVHKLTIEEMPNHDHEFPSQQQDNYASTAVTNTNDVGYKFKTSSAGGDKPHNNVQPSVVDARWRRIA